MFTFAACFGVTLDGVPAKLDVTKRGMIKVASSRDSAVFNASVASLVCREKGGRFLTKGAR